MVRPVLRDWSNPAARLAALLFFAGCATGATTTTAQPEAVPSHVYPFPLDNVLAQATQVLVKNGWHVQRSGNVLFTNWVGDDGKSTLAYQAGVSGANFRSSLVEYRVFGERIDAGYSSLRVERLTATPSSLDFGQKRGGHQTDLMTAPGARAAAPVHNEQRELMPAFRESEYLPEFAEDSANTAAATGVPSGTVLVRHQRDATLERELQQQIDPEVVVATTQANAPAVAVPADTVADGGLAASLQQTVNPVQTESRPTALAGIWDGTFTFRGSVTGTFSGEVTVAVDGESVDLDDFCPENGGTLSMRSSGNSASWQGTLACSPIRMKLCPAATFTYDFVRATLNGGTLTVAATGTVDTDIRCHDSTGDGIAHIGGPLTVAFTAQRADYVHIVVSRVKRATACAWPKDWEDFTSKGSMPMPGAQVEDAYLGIIRAKGSRLTEIQRLLRHCHQVVLLHGEPVLMKLAVMRTPTQ